MDISTVPERPILFSGPMVRAILEGRKSQTRRIVKDDICLGAHGAPLKVNGLSPLKCPYGKTGDRLWVRETWALDPDAHPAEAGPLYRATDPGWDESGSNLRWKPSIFMPRDRSRITLEVTGIRVERVQSIIQYDAVAEGICDSAAVADGFDARAEYAKLWNTINGKVSWESNPWVWVVEFRRHDANL